MVSTETQTLVDAIRRNDPEALATLYRMYFDRLVRYAYQLTHDRDLGETLVQDVFVAMWEARTSWRVAGSLDSYLYRAVRNRAWKVARDESTRTRLGARAVVESGVSPGTAGPTPSAADIVEHAELQTLLAQAVAALPARQREALALRWSHQLSYVDAAEVMQVSEARVRQLVARAEAQVREAVQPYLRGA